jgi:hypothetical protein
MAFVGSIVLSKRVPFDPEHTAIFVILCDR